jgi:hypothetical protein
VGIQLILAAQTPAPAPTNTFTWTNAATITAGIGAALIAALVAVIGYSRQQRAGRRAERATKYAEALQAVVDYLECPYRIRRRDGSAAARLSITETISATKSKINFYLAWLRIDASAEIATAYEDYVRAAQREAGPQMTAAWRTRPTRKDRDVPLGQAYPRDESDAARAKVSAAMKRDLDR